MASEVFNCEISKVTDLFFTSRAEVQQNTQKKNIQSSPLPKDEESDSDGDRDSDSDDKENAAAEVQKVEVSVGSEEEEQVAENNPEQLQSSDEPLNIDIQIDLKQEIVEEEEA